MPDKTGQTADFKPVNRLVRPVLSLAGVIFLLVIALYVWQRSGIETLTTTSNELAPGELASVNGKTLSVARFNEILGPYSGSPENADGLKRALIQEWIDFEVLLAQAKEQGYEASPEIREAHERMMVNAFREDQLRERNSLLAVSQGEIAEFYGANIEEFTTPAMAHAAMIEVLVPVGASDDKRATILEKANAARNAAMNSEQEVSAFGATASRYSDNQQTKYTGGDLGWLHETGVDYKLDPKLQAAIFAMDERGTVSEIVTTESGFYVLKLIERRPPAVRSLDDVKGQIRRRLAGENRRRVVDQFMADTRNEFDVRVNEELLETLQIAKKTAANGPPQMPATISEQ